MMDDKIGTIGSTHGVNDRPRPSKANKGRITSSLPLLSAASTRPLSDGGATPTGATGAGASLLWSTTVACAFGTALTATPAVTGEAAPAVEASSAATGVALAVAACAGMAGVAADVAAAGAEPSPVSVIFASIGA